MNLHLHNKLITMEFNTPLIIFFLKRVFIKLLPFHTKSQPNLP